MAPAVMGGATRSRSRGRPQLLLIGLVVLVAVSLLLALRSSLQSQPAEPTVRISPSSVEAGVAVIEAGLPRRPPGCLRKPAPPDLGPRLAGHLEGGLRVGGERFVHHGVALVEGAWRDGMIRI